MYLFYGLKANPTAEAESRIFRVFQHLIRNRPQEFLEEKGMPTDNASIKAYAEKVPLLIEEARARIEGKDE